MGNHEGWGLLPNGLLPNEAASVTRMLDHERWARAEERTAELIGCIQPNQPSEELRSAVADYVQRLIMKCFSCEVFTFGSVPLKTYLPDGDIDLTAFSENQTLKETWANEVRIMLENEEKSETAEFRVKEVQYIQAEVKIIKCLVENIVVDISFNQLGGLCTLCFLDEVDHLINQSHLFKRSIILIKAWCYYESRILGAHHGLISTYALETLVLYIFHVFNNSFTGPLEVLYRFLEFFSNFDWDNFCVSLWGPVPISSLPDMTAESPRKDGGNLLLSKLFLDACSSVYAVFPGGQENQGQPFVSKHFNVIDPLRTNNNLGRSVSKGNFFRIRSAFAFGAKRLARLLDCPKEGIVAEVNQFFMNTWERHGTGSRPDAPRADLWHVRKFSPGLVNGSEGLHTYSSSQKENENAGNHEYEAEDNHGNTNQHGNHNLESIALTSNVPAVSRTQSQKSYENLTRPRIADQVARNINSSSNTAADKGQRSSRPDNLVNGIQARYQFARTRSSPELLDTSSEVSSRVRRHRGVQETLKAQPSAARTDYGSRRKNFGSEISGSHSGRSSTDDPSSLRHSSSHQSLEAAADSNSTSINFHDEAGLNAMGEELASVSETIEMHQQEQDLVNLMGSSNVHGFSGQVQMPISLASSHLPFPLSPSVLASMGYSQRNLSGMLPANIPLIENPWGSNMLSHGLVSSSLSHYFPNAGLASNSEEISDSGNETMGLAEMSQDESGDQGFWREQEVGSVIGFDEDNGNFHSLQLDDKPQPTSVGHNFGSSSRASSSGSTYMRDQSKYSRENMGSTRENQSSGNEADLVQRSPNSRTLPPSRASSSRSRASSESSWDGLSVKVSKSTRDKRGRKVATPSVASPIHGKAKSGWQHEGTSVDHAYSEADDESKDWISLSTFSTEAAERNTGDASHISNNQISSYEPSVGGSDSLIPIGPVILGSNSRQRMMDNSGVLPFTFYPTGPPVPFLTMLPIYNLPADRGASEGSTSHFNRDDGSDSSRLNQSDHNFDSESRDQMEVLSSSSVVKSAVPIEHPEVQKSDILNSDFASHWQNLQYGRFCQNPRPHAPVIYPSQVMVPPMYLQGHFPWDGPGRPLSAANVNLFTQLMGYGPRLVPVAPLQAGSSRPAGVYPLYGDEVPRYRGGTGTYLPTPKIPFRERQSSGIKNQRGHYNYDRNDHHDREGNWNTSPKPRAAGRSHGRSQAEKPSSRSDRLTANDNRSNRQWDSHRLESFPHHSQNGPFAPSNSSHNGSTSMGYGMYQMPVVNSNGVASIGSGAPSFVLYSYDHSTGHGSTTEQLEFGSLGPVHFSGRNEVSQHEGGSVRGLYEQQRLQRGSPDQPSSPQYQR
ncbi:hypothetical protein Scep_006044 [Stephania cephalantha]|uniref:Polymerase nucleotidyl transferase domain-containing protein n=1 Tax=Stephania cephalantha TaxID=152367 RepID=A0AAP0K9R8_9MAGN